MKFILINLLAMLKNLEDSTKKNVCEMSLISSEGKHFPIDNRHPKKSISYILRKEKVFKESNWLGPGNFILDLGCPKTIDSVELVNANKKFWSNKSTFL